MWPIWLRSSRFACISKADLGRVYYLRHVILGTSGASMNYQNSLVVTLLIIFVVPNRSVAESSVALRGHPIKQESVGQTKNGTDVELYTIDNSHGVEQRAVNYGVIV